MLLQESVSAQASRQATQLAKPATAAAQLLELQPTVMGKEIVPAWAMSLRVLVRASFLAIELVWTAVQLQPELPPTVMAKELPRELTPNAKPAH